MPKTRSCETCDGRGYYILKGKKKNCSSCVGKGYVGINAPWVPPPAEAE